MSETNTIWLPYPKETPPRKHTYYLVTLPADGGDPAKVTVFRWNARTWQGITPSAWAELPEPFEEHEK